jgi:hypothetical protein
MNTLKVSDLFHKRGNSFTWTDRIQDQDNLRRRLDEFPDLKVFADELHEFTSTGIASVVFIEYLLEQITKKCAEKNIMMA